MAKRTISTEELSPNLLKMLVLCELTARRLMLNFSAISFPNIPLQQAYEAQPSDDVKNVLRSIYVKLNMTDEVKALDGRE